jgi:hypothetical protein
LKGVIAALPRQESKPHGDGYASALIFTLRRARTPFCKDRSLFVERFTKLAWIFAKAGVHAFFMGSEWPKFLS